MASENTKVSLGLIITLGTIVVGGIASFAYAQSDLHYVKAETAETSKEVREHDRRIQKVEDAQTNMLEILKEIKRDVRALRGPPRDP